MLGSLARILLTASSIAPVSLVYSWVAYMQGEVRTALISLAVGGILWVACLCLLRFSRRHLEVLPFRAASVEPADAESFGFMLLYLLPLLTDRIGTLNWSVLVPIVIVFSVIIGTGYGYHFNPLLGIMRWHFYKVTSQSGVTFVLVTKKQIRTAADDLRVGQLTEYILLDMGDEEHGKSSGHMPTGRQLSP